MHVEMHVTTYLLLLEDFLTGMVLDSGCRWEAGYLGGGEVIDLVCVRLRLGRRIIADNAEKMFRNLIQSF